MQRKEQQIKVSIILPVYNGEKYIGRSVQSVLDQTFENFELIVIDDKSTDNTIEIINKFQDPRIILIRHKENEGPAAARNSGIELAKGDWLAFIDADDSCHRERLLRLLNTAEMYPDTFVGSDVMLCFSDRNLNLINWRSIGESRRIKSEFIFFPTIFDFVKNGFDVKPMCPSQIIKEKGLKFREDLRGPEWMEFIFNLYRHGLSLVVINEPLYFYRLTPGSLSSTYNEIVEEIKSSVYLESMDWVDKKTKKLLRKNRKRTGYRLFASALREKRWKKALLHALESPRSLLYLLSRLPGYLHQKYHFHLLLKNH